MCQTHEPGVLIFLQCFYFLSLFLWSVQLVVHCEDVIWTMLQLENYTLRWLHFGFSILYMVLMTVIKPCDTSIPKQ
jgi:hypothetical protein